VDRNARASACGGGSSVLTFKTHAAAPLGGIGNSGERQPTKTPTKTPKPTKTPRVCQHDDPNQKQHQRTRRPVDFSALPPMARASLLERATLQGTRSSARTRRSRVKILTICTYSAADGRLVEDHDAGFCPAAAVRS
jgi:hypothetical protein